MKITAAHHQLPSSPLVGPNGPPDRPCPACQEKEQAILGTVAGRDALLCFCCGLAFMDPPKGFTYDYSDWYGWLDHTKEFGETCLESFKHCRKQARLLAELTAGRTLVEIGAGPGFFAQHATALGWTVACVELNPVARKFGSEMYGLRYKDLGEVETASADVARLSHVLEHIPAPVGFLAEIRRVLKPGGILEVVVPHYEPLDCVIKNLILRCIPGKHDLRTSMYLPQHVLGFSIPSLRRVLSRCGFQPIRIVCISRGNTAYYPWVFEGARPKGKEALFQIVNGLGNMFGRGSWIVGHFRV